MEQPLSAWQMSSSRRRANPTARQGKLILPVPSPAATLTFVVIAATLFVNQLGMIQPFILLAMTILYCVATPGTLMRSIRRQWPILLFPIWATMSVAWSILPGVSAYYAVELWLTIAMAILIGDSENRTGVLLGAFTALSLYSLSSVVLGRQVAWGADGGTAFEGLAQSKNVAGDTAVLTIIAAIAVIVHSVGTRMRLWTLAAIVVIPVSLMTLQLAHSAGAVLGLAIALFAALVVLVLKALPPTARIGAVAVGLLMVGAGLVFHAQISAASDWLMYNVFHKDSGLTGRTYLWYRAEELIREHPLLGDGYRSFWIQGNIDAEGLWRYAGIDGRVGFNFHNTIIETLVSLGSIGLIIFFSVILYRFVKLLALLTLKPQAVPLMWAVVYAYEVERMPIESIGMWPFAYSSRPRKAEFRKSPRQIQPRLTR
jgi:exopolysaccharide production protein ExoQ